MLDIKVKGQCVHSKLDGSAEELMQELVMLNIAVITNIIQNEFLSYFIHWEFL